MEGILTSLLSITAVGVSLCGTPNVPAAPGAAAATPAATVQVAPRGVRTSTPTCPPSPTDGPR
jgi:hypothetical protein